ncbi:protein RFT1 homolog isoform X2 [Strongylocentrotus purpuratus]|uniref:Protein RFT1 homolog n=1 Tax=Strongylocentrotus purpuratus TaxID=7668 RepID=A0A7M7RGH2_STRPU|nr:protein RFT1 homolog isoform X1 [Strongylocentrotus purpuratus]XP_791675.3 protein RFT1 homolog isoform X2 [Strongylocentrotus purpuratus]|eukprot:XP_011674796.1 PREDICTED: protein RFT1 homolog isoform X1 [Strongylocentrotus purpuratus]
MTAERDQSVLASSARSASYNMVLQVMFRVLTFMLNAFIIKYGYVHEDMLGVVNVRLMLLYSTILFIAREAFRRACLSQSSKHYWPQVINLLWCSLPLGVVCATILSYVWIALLSQPDPNIVPHYNTSVLVFAFSAVIELVAEPFWVVGQAMLFVRLKVVIEGIAIGIRCSLTVFFLIINPQIGITAFCIAQIVYSYVCVFLYFLYFSNYATFLAKKDDSFPIKAARDFFPRHLPDKPWTSPELARLTWSFFKQGFLKQLLTEGERYVMTLLNVLSFSGQGIYDAVNNLGALAARFIFLPIEESGYIFFSQTLKRGHSFKQQDKDSIQLASKVLQALLKFVVLVGSIILIFGFAYSYLLLDLYAGPVLSSPPGPKLLRWFCVYVLLLAINGTTECFVFAAMSQQEVDRYNTKMLGFSIVFLTSSWYLTKTIGSVGFILANCLNMLARIIHSIYFITKFYSGSSIRPLRGLFPSVYVLITLAFSWLITTMSELKYRQKTWSDRLTHIGIGGACLLGVLIVIVFTEAQLVSFIKEQWKERRKAKEEEKKKRSKLIEQEEEDEGERHEDERIPGKEKVQ